MNKMFLLKFKYLFAIALIMGLMSAFGCATQTPPGKMLQIGYAQEAGAGKWPAGKLEEAFRQYWFNRFSGRTEDGYNMENPYFREMVSLPKYQNYVHNTSKSKLIKMKIQEIIKVSEYLVKIDLSLQLQAGSSKPTEVSIADRWVYLEGKWYHVIRDPLFGS